MYRYDDVSVMKLVSCGTVTCRLREQKREEIYTGDPSCVSVFFLMAREPAVLRYGGFRDMLLSAEVVGAGKTLIVYRSVVILFGSPHDWLTGWNETYSVAGPG
jgi:hypothetical protein